MGAVSIEQIAQRTGVDEGFIHRLEELGAIHRDGAGYQERDVHVVALLHMWENAGLSVTSILAAVNAGQLSLEFLDAPAWELPEPLPITYPEFAEDQGIPFHLLQGIQESMGFASRSPLGSRPRSVPSSTRSPGGTAERRSDGSETAGCSSSTMRPPRSSRPWR